MYGRRKNNKVFTIKDCNKIGVDGMLKIASNGITAKMPKTTRIYLASRVKWTHNCSALCATSQLVGG
jgi:hypothetical protein